MRGTSMQYRRKISFWKGVLERIRSGGRGRGHSDSRRFLQSQADDTRGRQLNNPNQTEGLESSFASVQRTEPKQLPLFPPPQKPNSSLFSAEPSQTASLPQPRKTPARAAPARYACGSLTLMSQKRLTRLQLPIVSNVRTQVTVPEYSQNAIVLFDLASHCFVEVL